MTKTLSVSGNFALQEMTDASKKKVSAMQVEVGTEPDFVIIMKNNVQDTNVNNPAETAGKYMVYAEGPL